jgi:alkylation response protein AidB-like acyl-CoA dehydrogenase
VTSGAITGEERELLERSVQHAASSATGADLDAALAELGWPDALAADPRTAVSVVFEAQGRAGSTSSALSDVLAVALGVHPEGVSVVLPSLGGVALPSIHRADRVLVVTEGSVVAHVTADVGTRDVSGLDPALGLVEVRVSGAGGEPVATRAQWADALAVGRLALASELVGASRTMLQLARDHAVERVQFDRPIAGFQAVQHRLAEAYVAVEAADGAVVAGWDDGTALGASAAKAIAGRSARTVARHAQQVLAGIGFTTEHPLHLFVRRVWTLDRLLGDAKSLTTSLGVQLLTTREVPDILPL